MKENISRGLKRDQLFRVNASGRKQQQKFKVQNSKWKKFESNSQRDRIQGKAIFLRRDGRLREVRYKFKKTRVYNTDKLKERKAKDKKKIQCNK
jgi:hypothetical protein